MREIDFLIAFSVFWNSLNLSVFAIKQRKKCSCSVRILFIVNVWLCLFFYLNFSILAVLPSFEVSHLINYFLLQSYFDVLIGCRVFYQVFNLCHWRPINQIMYAICFSIIKMKWFTYWVKRKQSFEAIFLSWIVFLNSYKLWFLSYLCFMFLLWYSSHSDCLFSLLNAFLHQFEDLT